MVSLIGNRLPVLFCESENERKYDSIIFKLMFPNYKVVSAGGCVKVITKVKAYKQAGLPQKAYGIIDCDYREQSFLDGQRKHNVYSMPFFEIENFLFCEEILTEMIKKYGTGGDNTLQKVIVAVKDDFIKNKERFVIRNVATRLHELGFSDGIKKLVSREELISDYERFSKSINLDNLFNKYDELFEEIIEKNDLNTLLRYYDNKNILTDFDNILNFSAGSYESVVLPFLKENSETLLASLKEKYLNAISD